MYNWSIISAYCGLGYVLDFIYIHVRNRDYSQFNTLKGCKTDNLNIIFGEIYKMLIHTTFYKTTSLLFCKPISENDINKMISETKNTKKNTRMDKCILCSIFCEQKEGKKIVATKESHATSIWMIHYNVYFMCFGVPCRMGLNCVGWLNVTSVHFSLSGNVIQ